MTRFLRFMPFRVNKIGLDTSSSLGLARYLAWVALALILVLSALLAFATGNSAREVLLAKQRESASLIAENIDSKIYNLFTLRTYVLFGRIAPRQQAQYARLDEILQPTPDDFKIQNLRVYDHEGTINYATENVLVGRTGLNSEAVLKVANAQEPVFTLVSNLSYLKTLFAFDPPDGSFYLRTTYPMSLDNRAKSSDANGPALGVLEFSQDITQEMANVVRFQWSIIAFSLLFSLLFLSLFIFFVRRAERVIAARVQEKERLVKELNQSEKLAGMGRVIAGIAHEIRNPLGIIRSSAELLLKRSNADDKTTIGILNAIHDESKRLSQTVTDFLDYARPRNPRLDAIDMGHILDQALGFMEPEINRQGCTVIRSYSTDGTNLSIKGDKDLLYRAVYNIISNAVQALAAFNAKGGDKIINIRASRMDATSAFELAQNAGRRWEYLAPPGHKNETVLVLCFDDNGSGFGDKPKNSFLEPFVTTKDSGTGLGLAIVDSIIASHNGMLLLEDSIPETHTQNDTIQAENVPAAKIQYGARVRILLPA